MKRILTSKLMPILAIATFFVLSILNIMQLIELDLLLVTASLWVPIGLTVGVILGILITTSIGMFIKILVETFKNK